MEPRRWWALLAVLSLTPGCGRNGPSPGTPAQAPAVAAAPSPPSPTYTLVMTWISGQQPPQTTQTVFHDPASCDQARDAAIAEGRRLALEALATAPPTTAAPASPPRRYVGSTMLPSDAPATAAAGAAVPAPPRVAAFCATDDVGHASVARSGP